MLNVNTDVPTMEYIYSVLRGLKYHKDRQDVCHKRVFFIFWQYGRFLPFNHLLTIFSSMWNKQSENERGLLKIQYLAVFFPNNVCLYV